MNLVVSPWGDPIQDGKRKETKVVTYNIQDFWKNSDVTPVKDTNTLDPSNTQSRGGFPMTKKPLKQGKWAEDWGKLGGIS